MPHGQSHHDDTEDTPLGQTDPEIARFVAQEEARQFYTAKLIASENYASSAVLAATGTVLTNKYSEGYPSKRYYEGQQFIDRIEQTAIDRAKALFGADHANVQPYSGSPANLAAYTALIKKSSENHRILGLGLPEGGHLTHGWKVSATSRFFEAHHYSVSETNHLLDFDAIRAIAMEVRPTVIVCGATCYPRIIDFDRFAEIAQECGARLMADIAHIAGLVAAGVHPSPVPVADVVTTTTHKTLRGPRGGMILCKQKYAKRVDRAVFPGLQGGPHNNVIAGVAVALREASTPDFVAYATQVVANSRALADELMRHGANVITGGSDNHLVLFDATSLGASGKEAAVAMDTAGLEANANTVPFDPRPPMDPSGVRLGTAAITSRGIDEAGTREIARWIVDSVKAKDDPSALIAIRDAVRELMAEHPAPGFDAPYPSADVLLYD